jgi:outer membrane protein OmpA-like peptidoglycan-associated protein
MKKFLVMMTLLLSVFVCANAQTAIENPKFMDNWYFGVGGQASTPLDFNKVFPVNGSAAFVLGKQLTPVFGVNVEDNVWFGSHKNGSHAFGVPHFDTFETTDHNLVRANYLGVNATVNLTNLFLEYRGVPRTFELQTVTGLGWFHVFAPNIEDLSHNDLAAKTGLNFLFNLGESKAHGIYVQPAVLWNLTNPASNHNMVAFNKNGAQLALQVGYVYRFATSNGTHHFKTYDVGAMKDEINRLHEDLAKKPREVVVEKIVERTIVKDFGSHNWVVFFAQNSAELTADATKVLDEVPDNSTVAITGTASPEGTEERNNLLSEDRAEAVANYLSKRNIKIESVKGLGVQGEASNRVAIVTVK